MIESALRRDRLIALAALGAVTLVAWRWTLGTAGAMSGGGGMPGMLDAAVMMGGTWDPSYAGMIFMMWWIMMVAMMLPSVAPLCLVALAIHRREGRRGQAALRTGTLAMGYLAVWGAFSVAATLLQWGVEATGYLSPSGMVARAGLAGTITLVAGLYQLTPLKRVCLTRCRSPIAFLTAYWRPGLGGALRMGLLHGAFCLGCCWVLMGLLFVGGVMNPFWIGAIAVYVLLEKLVPHGERLSRASGLVLIALGVLTLLRAASE